jgi:Ca2+/Na+ antiporter
MIAVRRTLVSTGRSVNVATIVALACVVRCARVRIRSIHRDGVFIYVVAVHMMKVTIVKVVCMAVVTHSKMPTARTMSMTVCRVFFALRVFHFNLQHQSNPRGGQCARSVSTLCGSVPILRHRAVIHVTFETVYERDHW